ncbi:hypothetical protein RMI40_31765 [Pseudomonas protegens]|uniref:hypothetical protein n=1 Tax=Pseudomonas protegens TaxID=380021 RepID=UPI00287BC9FE|nr:hypothetical protein [Pseudomonas protegens]MDS9879417.1 hypothetical protein [Pseudomonas protegens]
MHPAMQARIDGMNALRARATVATAAFYEMIDKPAPERAVRFQAISRGKDAYHVVEVATGRVKGFRFTWKAAVSLALVLEARADGAQVNIDGWKQ